MALEVGIVGPAGSGKTSLFTALTKAGGGDYGKTNLGVAPIPDDRLGALAEVVHARKVTAATIRVQDVAGSGAALLGNLRQVEALLVVVAGFGPNADPEGDLETFRLELIVADVDHVQKRLERVEKQAKSGDAKLRAELEELRKVLAHVETGASLADYSGELPAGLEPLTTKPLIAVINGPAGIDLKLEAELAELPDDEAEAFRDGGASALAEVVQRLRDSLNLITFFTAGEQETRAWTLHDGETALDAADSIHSDIARGFIRCEVSNWKDLVEAGSHAELVKRALQRLEGKTYVVRDGDVLNIRFNV
jgi:ribosome-binding ATPase